MSRYIDAEKLITVLRDGMIDENDWSYESPAECRGVLEFSIAEVKKIPTADVAEVKHGRWLKIEKQPHLMRCSVCGSTSVEGNLNYCPRCGAKMDEVEE